MGDFGIRISPRVEQSPLWALSPRALRLWLYLAMKSQHAPAPRLLPDGRRLVVAPGQWLTSARKLLRDVGRGGSLRTITRDLEELRSAGVITVELVRGCYPTGNRGVTDSTTGGVTKRVTGTAPQGNGVSVLATLVTVVGIQVSEGGVTKRVTQLISKGERDPKASPSVSRQDQQDWERAERILAAEGR